MERITNKDIPAGLMQVMRQVGDYLKTTDLDPLLLELLKIRVSQINSCAYCLDMHYKEALNAGETGQRLLGLAAWREAPYYSHKERAVLSFAERLTRIACEELPEDLHEELKEFFSLRQIAHLSLAVAQINSWNRLMKSFGATAGNYQVSQVHAKSAV